MKDPTEQNIDTSQFVEISEADFNEIKKNEFDQLIIKLEGGHIQVEENKIVFEKVQITEKIELTEEHLKKSLVFRKCIFSNKIFFWNSTKNESIDKGVYFIKCSFDKTVQFDWGRYNAAISFKNIFYLKEIRFNDGEFNNFEFVGGYLYNVEINSGIFSNFFLGSEIVSKESKKEQNTFETEKFECQVKNLNIKDEGNLSGLLILKSLKVYNLHLQGRNLNYSLSVGNLFCQIFEIENFLNNNSFKLQNVKYFSWDEKEPSSGKFSILNSDLDKSEFHHVNLNSFPKLELSQSYLGGVVFNIVNWPAEISIREDPIAINDSEAIKLEEKKEFYRQIKTAYQKQGDTINAKKFYEREMDTYLSIKPFPGNRQEWWVLKLSKLTSNYGQSLKSPFWVLIGSSALFSLLMILINFSMCNEFPILGGEYTINNGFELLLTLTNPLHKIEVDPNAGILLMDLLNRVVVSYMIYNFIRASRRFV